MYASTVDIARIAIFEKSTGRVRSADELVPVSRTAITHRHVTYRLLKIWWYVLSAVKQHLLLQSQMRQPQMLQPMPCLKTQSHLAKLDGSLLF